MKFDKFNAGLNQREISFYQNQTSIIPRLVEGGVLSILWLYAVKDFRRFRYGVVLAAFCQFLDWDRDRDADHAAIKHNLRWWAF